jgi:hypothetical protein
LVSTSGVGHYLYNALFTDSLKARSLAGARQKVDRARQSSDRDWLGRLLERDPEALSEEQLAEILDAMRACGRHEPSIY